jgi:hypothetical protein
MQPNFKRDNQHCFVLFGNRRSNELRKPYACFFKLSSVNTQIKVLYFHLKCSHIVLLTVCLQQQNNWCKSKHECPVLCYYRCKSQKQFISRNVNTPHFTFVVGTEMTDYTISSTRFKSIFSLMSDLWVFQHHSLQQ